MISTSTNEPAPLPADESRIGLLNGRWVPHSEMTLSIDDVGFRQGVTAVERLRTYGGRIFALDAHLRRWEWSTSKLGIDPLPSIQATESLLSELLQRNAAFVQAQDVGITMFATPGVVGQSTPTLGMHLNRLNDERIELHRQRGQAIVVTDVRQPPASCWPRSIKTRSRIHYYLADAFAAQHHADSLGVLIDDDGTITETSTSNIAVVCSDAIYSPPADRVLAGVTQLMIELLAQDASISWTKTPVSVSQLVDADEVLLMGTDGGIWFGNSVSNHAIGNGEPGSVFLALRERFDQLVGDTLT